MVKGILSAIGSFLQLGIEVSRGYRGRLKNGGYIYIYIYTHTHTHTHTYTYIYIYTPTHIISQ